MIRLLFPLFALGALACTQPAPAPAPPSTGVADGERLTFASTAWSGGRGQCSEGTAADGCDSEWRHTESKQLVRVFVVPVNDPRATNVFVERLAADVVKRGGLADRIEQNGLVVLRYLEESQQGSLRVASISYALVGRDQKAVHLITSVVPYDDQQGSDARLRELLTSASWFSSTPAP